MTIDEAVSRMRAATWMLIGENEQAVYMVLTALTAEKAHADAADRRAALAEAAAAEMREDLRLLSFRRGRWDGYLECRRCGAQVREDDSLNPDRHCTFGDDDKPCPTVAALTHPAGAALLERLRAAEALLREARPYVAATKSFARESQMGRKYLLEQIAAALAAQPPAR